ncbi:MAG: glucosamine 6-phosphate synthetase [Anaerolineae bacterium]|nr:glucosamine 6-phosphate synthetase [Anaerolineae bacterium]
MCGLVGLLLYPQARAAGEWQAIRACFTRALLANEERGRDASGVAIVQRDGSFALYKAPLPASELVATVAYEQLLDRVGSETVCLLGHTRMPTKGSSLDNANNHPVLAGHVLGVHNGHIGNDDLLFAQLKLPRAGQVDSEVIFRLLDSLPVHTLNGNYLYAVRQKVTLLEGHFATLSVDIRLPTKLLVLKRDMPLCLHYHKLWQALYFSSRYAFLRQAFGQVVVTEALPSRHIYLFDAEQLPARGTEPAGMLSLD